MVKTATAVLGEQIQAEFLGAQVEACTRPTADPAELRSELGLLRRVMGEVAADEGRLLVATGTPVLPPGSPPTVTPGDDAGGWAPVGPRWSVRTTRWCAVVTSTPG
ncbi:hypothetical protein ACFXA3_28345 [Streptomyces sp. NPDC059456]|uniref:hypothetical protein n=1 Tax=Streptomyces sp. NPDC059456 TaxID=3346838 RepID=UPI003686696B